MNEKQQMERGVYINGMYTGMRLVDGKNGKTACVSVLAGPRDVYQVYMKNDGGGELQAHRDGESIFLYARPYVNAKHFLTWTDGVIIAWPDAAA